MVVTNRQVKGLFRHMSEGNSLEVSAAKAGMCENTARKYVRLGRSPGDVKQERRWRTRPDPLEGIWPQVQGMLEAHPGLLGTTILQWAQGQPGSTLSASQLRTLQRRIRWWRARSGEAQEVFFAQVHRAGELGASDFTEMNSLQVTLGGVPFEHMIHHYTLTWSNWEHLTVCFSESFESLSEGVQNAWWKLGGVPAGHRTDRLSAAVNNLDERRDFTQRYKALQKHYGVVGYRTNPNSGNENGDAEQRHRRLKQALEQALLLRGSRDFADRAIYERFLGEVVERLNATRRVKVSEEVKLLRPLPDRRLPAYRELCGVLVSQGSTIQVQRNTYSVHSRLRDYHVDVRVHSERVEVYYAGQVVEQFPRLRGSGQYRINYRHIIDWLVRKPGAFANYRYREELFPSSYFRMAYDALRSSHGAEADKQYLKVLYLAARESEELVGDALRQLLQEAQEPCESAVEALITWMKSRGVGREPVVQLAPPDLQGYDRLLDEPCAQEVAG